MAIPLSFPHLEVRWINCMVVFPVMSHSKHRLRCFLPKAHPYVADFCWDQRMKIIDNIFMELCVSVL
ncbi:hypothetical protein NPIL_705061 [Nephila pilipes]|uniref:Uncharacterized protein n=1 Tax=Nephila pilipes TaxID=299642 RepID=A0A8X6QI44_NEPPI|nr:hypothetical protein NPIL_705061 [Nephila pilipes]